MFAVGRVEIPLEVRGVLRVTFSFSGRKETSIIVNAVEQSFPQKPFNFVFNRVSFNLWKASLSCTYFEEKDKASVNINFSIALKEKPARPIHFDVEEHEPGVVSRSLLTQRSAGLGSSRTDYTGYVASTPQVLIEEAKDFRLRNNVTEMNGNRFNFYVMTHSNY